MIVLRAANLALSFVMELAMLAAFGYWGYHAPDSFWISVLLGVMLPVLVAVIWAVFMAPKATRRLQQPWFLLFAFGLFGLAAVALYRAGEPALAGLFGVLVVINQVARYVLQQ